MLYWQQIVKDVTDKSASSVMCNMPKRNMHEKGVASSRVVKRYYFTKDHESIYLTHREAGCVYYVMQGCTIKKTASQLSLSPRTVEFYLKRIRDKLHCQNRTELMVMLAEFKVMNVLADVDFSTP